MYRVGEINTANNGQNITIIAYRSYKDIDIQFEDGTLVTSKEYKSFKNGEIKNPNYNPYKSRVGETNIAKNGQKMNIISYRSCNDISVQFEDGTLVTNKSYKSFKRGNIKNPNFYNKFLGESNIANNGQKMTIVAYRGCNDIDIQFEDGTIVTNRRYESFKRGGIGNPNYNPYESRLGEVGSNNAGQKMTIIAYRSFNDIDIQFEDGTVVINKDYTVFKSGNIRNSNFYNKLLGETNIATNGQKMAIISYRSAIDIDVQFEDGTIATNKSYANFKKGCISHPAIDTKYRGIIKDHKLLGLAYKLGDKSVYYYCECTKCGKKDILSPQQILSHKCEE